MKRRIFGLENEYGLTCTLNGQRRLSPDNVARYLFEKVIPGARNANVFLENGARLYLDTGFHPEYATPECDDITELVIHDKAGERIVEDLLHQAEKRLREDGISGNILLFNVGASNMSEVATYLKIGTTALVLDMIEDGFFDRDYSLQSPVQAIRDISHDPTLRETVKLKDGRAISALQLQLEYLEYATRYVNSINADPVTKDVLARWTDVLEKLETDPMQLERELDWVIKRQWIESYMTRNRLSWRDPKISLMDLQYHDIRPDRGVYYKLASRDMVDRVTDDETIEQAKHVPPQTTRARLRGEFIRQANLKGKDYRVDWVYLKLNDPERETILCKDPFQSHDERVARLIRSF